MNSTYPSKFRKDLERKARSRGIDFIFSDYVDTFPEPGTPVDLTTRNGQVIKGVDLVVSTHSQTCPIEHESLMCHVDSRVWL